MKGTDLMIGDWVLRTTPEREAQEFRALGWDVPAPHNVKVGAIMPFANTEYEYDYFTPIPLTEEILEKNGYTCKRSLDKEIRSYNWTSPDRRVTLNDNNGSPWFCIIRSEGMMEEVMIGITYIHELQHALRLCGIEKEIML